MTMRANRQPAGPQLRLTPSASPVPSTRRIGRGDETMTTHRPLSVKLEQGLGNILFGRRERSDSKESKEDSDYTRGASSGVPAWQEQDIQRRLAKSHSSFRKSKDDDEYSEAERPKSKGSKTLGRKSSRLKMLFGSGIKTAKPNVVAMTDEMIRLETVVQSDKGRHMLVQELLKLKGDFSVKVRFCSAVDKFDAATDEREREVLANGLIQTFLVHGCMFYISCLSDARYRAIADEGHHNQLLDAKREVLDELTKYPEVMRIVDHIETMEDL